MRKISRSCAIAGAALAAANVIAVTPTATRPSGPAVRSIETHLVDADSILNIPFNLLQDIINIPNTEVEAMNVLANSLIYSGNWFTASATNIWGTDPGDLGHYMGLIDMLIPFKEISGLDQPEIDPVASADGTAGLAQQLGLLAAAELPVSASCDADWCSPAIPTTTITGLTRLDFDIWFTESALGQQQFPLFDNWFTVPLSDLEDGYTFNLANDSGLISPNNGVGVDGSVPSEFGFDGTISGPDGENLMPWAGDTFTLNLLGPFENFYNSLLTTPDYSDVEFPTLTEFTQTLQTLAAGMVIAFDPFIEGSPVCPGACELPPSLTMAGIVEAIGDLSPGNPVIDQWLTLYNTPTIDPLTGLANPTGLANGATQEQVDYNVQFLQQLQATFDFGNPAPSDVDNSFGTPQTLLTFPVDSSMQNLITFMQESGVQSVVQQLADWAGFTPASYPLNYTDVVPSSLDGLLTELGLGGVADSAASSSADLSGLLAEFANQAAALQMDLLDMVTQGLT